MCSTSEIFYKSSSPHWAVVLHTYRPKCDDELCLTTGQAIQVLSIDPKVSGSDGWWVGQDNYGQVGVFPANYVQLQVSGSDDDDDHQHHRNSSEGQGSSLQDSTSSFSLDGTLVANRVATQLLLADSARGTGGESDGEGRLRRNFKWDSSVVGLSHLRVIKFEDVTLGDSIGAGSFGTVYRGTWEDKTVALKVYHQASSQVQREALNLGQLSHRNIVEFFGLWETHETLSHLPALVMEFAHGGALHTVVRRRPAIRPSTLANWSTDIAKGMCYLHEQAKLVHRDLKTANILIREPLAASPTPDDLQNTTLIISDFGMSCPTDAVGSRVSGVGTAAYAAPEVICMEFYSPASDVWSYGVVIWEIFTMLEPFKEFDRAQQLVNIGRNRQKLFIPRVECDFPEFMDALLTRCWADERADRPSFSYILEYLSEVQKDAFFTLSSKEFTVIQDAWRLEISNESELSLSESCSSEASSPLRRQNEYLQRENAKMRDALQTLQLNEARYRGTIAGLQKNNQILSVLVANTLYNNTAALAAPAPRKKPFVKSLFRRNEQKTVSQSPMPTGDGDSQSGAPDRSPRDYSPAVKPGGRRHGARKPSKSSPGISYPSEVRHVVHVPSELVFDQANALPTTLYRGLNFSPGSCAYIAPSVPSPTSPTLFAGGSTSSSSFLRPRTDSQSTEPPLHPGSLIFSPSDDAAETARFFAFLNVHNGFTAPQPTSQKRSQQKRQAKSLNVEGLTSYKSAPELSEQVNRSVTKLNTLEGRHTVSRGSTLEPSTSSSRKPVTSLASGSQGGGGGSSKRHRMGLSALFHTSRSKHSSTSGKPSSPLVESVSCLPPAPPSTTEPSPTPLLPPSTTSVTTVQPHRLGNKRKSFSTTPRKILLHKIFQTERNKQRRINSGNSKTSPSVTASNQTESTSPASPKYLPEQATQSSSEFENMKAVMETSQSALVPAAGTIPPLPPYLLRQGIKAKEPRRRLLDIVRSPPSLFSSTVFSNARPYAPSNISDEEVKGEFRRRQFVRCPKSQSLDILFQPEEMNGTDVSKGQEEVNPMNPVPLALWSALKIASLAPLLLGSQNRINMSTVPSRSEPPTAPQSASFTRVTFSPFTFNGEDLTATALGKAQSCLGRISSTLALTTAFVGRSRHPTRKPWNAQRELSAPTPSSSPWQQMLNHPPPVYYSPPPGGGPDTCCKCGCHSTGESRQSSSATTTTSSQSSSSWLPVDNPVALSRDAYLKVTQDGYLNRSAINGNFNNDDKAGGVQSPSMLLMQSVGGFSPSPLFSHSSFLHQQQRSSNSPTASFLGSPDAVDPVDDVILLPGEEVGEPSFGAGEAAEDTATLYAEFQQLPNQTSYEAVFDASMSEVRSVERGGYAPIPDLSIPVPHEPGGTTGSTADRPTDLLSFPCRRRKAFRLKDKPEGLLSSPEDEVESDAGCSDNSTIPLTP